MSQFYGTADGYSFCNFNFELNPDPTTIMWMQVDDNVVTIGANTAIDAEDSVTITVAVSRDGSVEATRTLFAELVSDAGSAAPQGVDASFGSDIGLEFGSSADTIIAPTSGLSIETIEKSDLPETVPSIEPCIDGHVQENEVEDIWYVPKQFYRLSKVELHSTRSYTSGFTVTFTRPDDAYFEGWPEELTHTFGSTVANDFSKSVELDQDLASMILCVENSANNEILRDFEGF